MLGVVEAFVPSGQEVREACVLAVLDGAHPVAPNRVIANRWAHRSAGLSGAADRLPRAAGRRDWLAAARCSAAEAQEGRHAVPVVAIGAQVPRLPDGEDPAAGVGAEPSLRRPGGGE